MNVPMETERKQVKRNPERGYGLTIRGFRAPEIRPSAYAMVKTVRPKAKETPTSPIPINGSDIKFAANTALPQPPSTSHKVPINSAIAFFILFGFG